MDNVSFTFSKGDEIDSIFEIIKYAISKNYIGIWNPITKELLSHDDIEGVCLNGIHKDPGELIQINLSEKGHK